MAFVGLVLIYSLSTSIFGLVDTPDSSSSLDTGQPSNRYCWCRIVECTSGILLIVSLALTTIGMLPIIPDIFQALFSKENKDTITTAFSITSALAGIGSTLGIFAQSNKGEKSKWLPVLVAITLALLATGVLLLAYQIAVSLTVKQNAWFIVPLVVLPTIGALSNLNYVSVHRNYRDRLMETFMPDVAKAVMHDGRCPGISINADRTLIQNMCDADAGSCGPYHLINTNIVLVESKRPKFKVRGGDNFILSPQFCGSNATGWRASPRFMDGGMTLATAMTISGAAVNPNARLRG